MLTGARQATNMNGARENWGTNVERWGQRQTVQSVHPSQAGSPRLANCRFKATHRPRMARSFGFFQEKSETRLTCEISQLLNVCSTYFFSFLEKQMWPNKARLLAGSQAASL